MPRRYNFANYSRFEHLDSFDEPKVLITSSSYGSDDFVTEGPEPETFESRGWTKLDPTVGGAIVSAQAYNGKGVIRITNGPDGYYGYVKNVPPEITGSYTVSGKFSGELGPATGTRLFFFFVCEDLITNPTTGNQYSILRFGDFDVFRMQTGTAPLVGAGVGGVSTGALTAPRHEKVWWWRIRVSGSTGWLDWSWNGREWINGESRAHTLNPPAGFGFMIRCNDALAGGLTATIHWIRVRPGHEFELDVRDVY